MAGKAAIRKLHSDVSNLGWGRLDLETGTELHELLETTRASTSMSNNCMQQFTLSKFCSKTEKKKTWVWTIQ